MRGTSIPFGHSKNSLSRASCYRNRNKHLPNNNLIYHGREVMLGNYVVFPKIAALPRWITLQCKREKPIVKKITDLTRPIVAQVLKRKMHDGKIVYRMRHSHSNVHNTQH